MDTHAQDALVAIDNNTILFNQNFIFSKFAHRLFMPVIPATSYQYTLSWLIIVRLRVSR